MSGWKDRLRAFDAVHPDERVYRRAREGSRGEPPLADLSGRKRLAAGLTAFVVFAAAATFAWQAFRPSAELKPIGGADADQALILTLRAPAEGDVVQTPFLEGTPQPEMSVAYDGVVLDATPVGYTWCDAPDTDCQSVMADYDVTSFLPVPTGTKVVVKGDASEARGSFGPWRQEGRSTPMDSGVPEELGNYQLLVDATFPLGSVQFAVGVRATDAEASRVPEAAPADVARVICKEDSIRIETPVVRASPDGVQLMFENPGEMWGYMLRHPSDATGSAEGGELADGSTEVTSAISPGEVAVACLPRSDSSYDDPEAATATLTVVDPDGLHVPWELSCGFGEQSRLRLEARENEKAVDVFRRVPGIRSSDEFIPPNYPGSPQYWPTFIVFRDGVAVARIMGPYIKTEWKLLINACADIGIAS